MSLKVKYILLIMLDAKYCDIGKQNIYDLFFSRQIENGGFSISCWDCQSEVQNLQERAPPEKLQDVSQNCPPEFQL